MKLLVFQMDGMSFQETQDWLDDLPMIKSIVGRGSLVPISSESWSSYANWASLYTGEDIAAHGIAGGSLRKGDTPNLDDIKVEPIWTRLARHGRRTGVCGSLMISEWACVEIDIMGSWMTGVTNDVSYRVSRASGLKTQEREIHSSYRVSRLVDWSKLGPFLAPLPLEDYGLQWEDDPTAYAKYSDVEHLESVVPDTYYEEGIGMLTNALDIKFANCSALIQAMPVDMLLVYDARMDVIGHFTNLDRNKKVLKKAYQAVDEELRKFIEEFSPEHVVLVSDHSMHRVKQAKIGYMGGIVVGEHLLPALGASSFKMRVGALPPAYHPRVGVAICDFMRIIIRDCFDVDLWEPKGALKYL